MGRGHGFHGRRAELAAVLTAVHTTAPVSRGRQDEARPAARRYAAALRHVPPDRQEHANVLTFPLSLLVQNGQYDSRGDVLADEARAAATDPAVRNDLEAAAMLTAFHTGHPVKVAHEPIHGGPPDLHDWPPLIENHLTRLVARSGCRSRADLAAASIDGRIKEPGS